MDTSVIDFIKDNIILVIIWVGVVIALIQTTIKRKNMTYKEVDPSQATHLINREDAIVIDVRSKNEFKSGHIVDAHHILPSDIKEGVLGSLENNKTTPIIVVCKTGQTSQTSAELLVKTGFENINVLKNGLISWNDANLPLIKGKKSK